MASLGMMVVAVVVLAVAGTVSGQVPCQGDISSLTTQCSIYVLKPGPIMDPSEQCCQVIRNADVPCICAHITVDMEVFLDMEKVVHVADFCGNPLPHGSKCGSYIVPFSFL